MSKKQLALKKEGAEIYLAEEYDGIYLNVDLEGGESLTIAKINEDGILVLYSMDEEQIESLKPYFEFDGDYVETDTD